MRRLTPLPALLLSLGLALPLASAGTGWAQDDEEDEEEDYAEPPLIVEYFLGVGNALAAGFNGMLTAPADPVAFAGDGDEIFEELPLPAVTGALVGFPAGACQAVYRASMGAADVVLALVPRMPILSPVPRWKIVEFEHPDE